ncbi:hypothetical protein M0R04_11840 [Candidatus Dojkabacteria bacterium]|jgi:hypothetical protein|nr:hypothetical protein [Candidatus Dojkabacteria bacterium]
MANDAIFTKEAEEKDNVRFKELKEKKQEELTPEEKTELGDLKDRHSTRVQKRIDTITAQKREAEEEAERLRKENEELRNKTAKKEEDVPESVKGELVEIAGKKYFTDKALIAQIKTGELTEDEAYQYQRKRDKEEVKWELRQEQAQEERKVSEQKTRQEDMDNVLKTYPQFSKKHPDFNDTDPLYKLANEIYVEGYIANPKGLSLAIKRAKEILRITDEKIDRSDDHSVDGSEAPERNSGSKKEVTLSEQEKESAVRMYTRGDVINPKTGRAYTENEAVAKALEAKKRRRA